MYGLIVKLTAVHGKRDELRGIVIYEKAAPVNPP
jgi:hypothetical protein